MIPGGTQQCVIPVLLYHAVTEEPGHHIAPFSIPPVEFERHLDAVVATGRSTISFGELIAAEVEGESLHRSVPPIVITFDDGYADFADAALPALQTRSLRATLFLTTGWLAGGGPQLPGPTDRMLSWSQLPELLECGVELGAHSHSHPQMDTLSARNLREELVRPRELLEQHLGRLVDLFAYPHGYNGPRVRRVTRSAGYRAAAAVRNAVHPVGENPLAISRLMVTRSTTAEDITRWLDGTGIPVARPQESPATRAWRAYRRGRAVLTRIPGSDYR